MSKIEQKIKEEISSRKINPSAAAWKALEAHLDTQPLHSSKRKSFRFLIYPVAASVVLLGLILGTRSIWPNQNTPDKPTNEVPVAVEEETPIENSEYLFPKETNQLPPAAISESQMVVLKNMDKEEGIVGLTRESETAKQLEPIDYKQSVLQNSVPEIAQIHPIKSLDKAKLTPDFLVDAQPENSKISLAELNSKSQTDSIKPKSYIDKDMLLFGIENKEYNQTNKSMWSKAQLPEIELKINKNKSN